MNINEIQDLIKFVAKAGVNEVEIEKKDFKAISIDGYEYMFVTDGYCWATPTPCSNTMREIKIIHNYTFFAR